jgi:hypothetical protein
MGLARQSVVCVFVVFVEQTDVLLRDARPVGPDRPQQDFA